jgi:hypothetical protein
VKHLNRLSKKVYQEEGSTFTHHGREYDLNKIFRLIGDLTPVKVSMKSLSWNLMKDLDRNRVNAADTSIPLIVSLEDGIYYVLDGNHRLVKLHEQHQNYVNVILVPKNLLDSCLL